jgi:hypothetical protein
MDILHLIDRLETLVTESFHLPFTSNVIIQEDSFLDIIDQMRVSIPEEVKLAKRTEAERERLLLQAEEEANRVVDMARDRAGSLTDEHELVTDEYIIDQLSELEEQLMKTLTTVRNGLRHVQETRSDHKELSSAEQDEAVELEEEFEE